MKKLYFIVFFIFCIALISNVSAFHEVIDSINLSDNEVLGQKYKYALSGANTDNPKRFPVFSTTYSIESLGTPCTLNNNWNEPTRAGIAKIIDEFGLSNYSANAANGNSEILNKYVQLTLTINQFLINKNGGGNENKIFNNGQYTEPKNNFSIIDGKNPEIILEKAEQEYERVKAIGENGSNVKIEIRRDDSLKKIIYDSNKFSSIFSSELEIEAINIDNGTLSLKVANQTVENQAIPEGIEIFTYVSADKNNFGEAKAILNSSVNSVQLAEIPDAKKFYVKFELVDSRTDKSGQFIVTPAVYLGGKFEYRVGAEYECEGNSQKLTPNRTELQKVIAQNIKGFTFKTPGLVDYPLLQIIKSDDTNTFLLLNDAEYKITYTVDGQKQETIVKTGSQGINGMFLFEGIESEGEYCVEEISAPAGYSKDNTKHCFNVIINSGSNYYLNIQENDDSIEYFPENSLIKMSLKGTKKGVAISKQDITTKKELSGAHLILKNSQGQIVENGDWISTDTPRLFVGLLPGTYSLEEVSAPGGYTLNKEKVTFTVDENGVVSGNTVMFNTPIVDVPLTDKFKSILFISTGIMISIFGIILFIYQLKKWKYSRES